MRRRPPGSPKRRRLLWAGLALGVVALGTVLTLTTCTTISIEEETVFLPRKSVTPSSFDYPELSLSQHWIEHDGTRLRAWHLTRENATGTVLLFGGNGFYLVQSSSFIETITESPVNLVMWDYRGYGQSEGSPSVATTKQDGLAVYDWVTGELGVSPDRLVLYGHSLGTFVGTYVAANADREVAGLVLQNPATNVTEWSRHLAPWYVRLFVNLDIAPALHGEDNRERLARYDGPVLIGGGKEDMITSWKMARDLAADLPEERTTLVIDDEATHNTLLSSPAFTEELRRFIGDVLASR